jgi:cyclophilin family peptidyl-prolyl cis-trans isomerase
LIIGGLLSFAVLAAPSVDMQTSMGRIVIELDAEKAPKTVQNFVQYVNEGFYNGTVFHRVIPGFMIQGGGFTVELEQKPAPRKVQNEARNGLKNAAGPLPWPAPATRIRRAPSSSSITATMPRSTIPQPTAGATPFSARSPRVSTWWTRSPRVATGNRSMHQNVPLEPVIIQSVKIIPEKGKP